jgi:hypothetical protein
MEILLLVTIGLYLIALASVLLVVRQHSKLEKDEDPVPCEDMPGHYEDFYEVSERPYYNP